MVLPPIIRIAPPELLSVSEANNTFPPVVVRTKTALSSVAVVIFLSALKIKSSEEAYDLIKSVFKIISRSEANVIGPLISISPLNVMSLLEPVVTTFKSVGCVDEPKFPDKVKLPAFEILKV